MGRRSRHLHKTTKQWTGSACLLLAGALLVPQVANAETVYWQPPDSNFHDWFTASNWSGGTIPQADDDVVVDDPTYAAYATQTSSIASLRLETSDETSEAKVVQTSGTLTISKVDTTDEYGTLTINDDTYSIPLSNDLLSATGDALYQLQGGTLVKSGYEVKIGTSGYGQFEQSGGEFQFSGAMYLGDQVTGLGKYTMTNGSLVAGPGGRGGIVLGEWGGTGIFLQSGGTVEIADLTLARQAFPVAASGYYALSEADHAAAPSSLNVSGPEYIGAVGKGVFEHTGGQHWVDTLVVGSSRPELVLDENGHQFINWNSLRGDGTYTLDIADTNLYALELTVNGSLIVGDGGTGVFDHISGDVSVGGDLIVGQKGTPSEYIDSTGIIHTSDPIPGTGTYNLSDGLLWVNASVYVGKDAGSTGTFNQAGGSHFVNDTLYVDATVDSKGTYNLSGGDLFTVSTVVGSSGSGTFNQGGDVTPATMTSTAEQNGGWHCTTDLILGEQAGSSGTYNLGAGMLITDNLFVGNSGTGTFKQSGGEVSVDTKLIVGRHGSSTGTYDLSNGTLASNRTIVGDEASSALFDHSGGKHLVGNDMIIGQDQSSGTYTLSDSAYLEVQGSMYLGDMGGTGRVEQAGASTNVIRKDLAIGSSSENPTTAHASNGGYTLSGGELQVFGNLKLGVEPVSSESTPNDKGTYTQNGGNATVGGTMTIATGSEASLSAGTLTAGNLTNNGTLNLFKAGLLTVGDTFTNNGTLFLDLDNYVGGSFITLTNSTAVLNGTLQIDWHGTAQETTFTLLSAAQGFSQGSDLVFEFLNLPIVQNFHWEYTYTTNDVLLSLKSGPSPVPVPSTMVLLGSALTALAGCRRRRATTH